MEISKESLYWVFQIIFIMVIGTVMIFILGSLADYHIDTNSVESYIIRNKIILDENCLAYKEGRIHMGSIDKEKFNEVNMMNCLNTDKGIILNLTYSGISEKISINEDLTDKVELCFDEELFSCIREEYNLILVDKEEKVPSKLIIDTITLR